MVNTLKILTIGTFLYAICYILSQQGSSRLPPHHATLMNLLQPPLSGCTTPDDSLLTTYHRIDGFIILVPLGPITFSSLHTFTHRRNLRSRISHAP